MARGFQKGHLDFVPKEGRKRQSEKMKGKLPKNWHPQLGFKRGHNLNGFKGKHHSEKSKNKMRKLALGKYIGEKNGNWQGGKSFEPYTIDWTETLKRSIRERDNYICQLCNQYGNTCHHIDYDKKNCNPDNLITLCRVCNLKVNKNRDYWIKYFKN